jgi:thiol-disulfide isomerase/thioredoxin
MMMKGQPSDQPDGLPIEGALPPLEGVTEWLNSAPLTTEALKGKVVLIDFWTYSCINCLRAIPYVRAWADKYKDQGLVVIGVHAPEFAFEKNVKNVRTAVSDLKIDYPVAVDNDYASGVPSIISTGRRIISSMLRVESATIILAKASMPNRSGSSSNSWRKPARQMSPLTSSP